MGPKILFLIADGMGDWPLPELGGRTVMAAADTPHMDQLARTGAVGLCRTVPHDMPPGSDVANMSLLGFDPRALHTGRGPIEAAAQGLDLSPGDLVWRLNLVNVSEYSTAGLMRDYSSGHIDNAAAANLIRKLQDELGDETFSFYPGVSYRHLLVQKNGGESPEANLLISPPHDITDKPLAPDLETYAKSPALSGLLERSAELLASEENPSKANLIWPWGQGRPLSLPNFESAFGLKGAVISAVDLVKGLGRGASMEVLEVEGATGLLDTNYQGKVQAALDFLKQGDFVYLHVEAPDECGHGGDAAAKVESIQRFDELIVGPLLKALGGTDSLFMIACDHLTPIVEKTHVSDPVPFLVSRAECAPGTSVDSFDEQSAAQTGLMIEPGCDLLPWILKKLRKAE